MTSLPIVPLPLAIVPEILLRLSAEVCSFSVSSSESSFWSRIAVFLALIFGYVVSWAFDGVFGQITSILPGQNVDASGVSQAFAHDRISWANVSGADWIGFPSGTLSDGVSVVHGPSFSLTFILLVLPGVIALIAENTGHVKAVAEMTKTDLDPVMGRAIAADGVGTVLASAVGGSPTTTYAENIGVMAATRVYSTAAYYVAALPDPLPSIAR